MKINSIINLIIESPNSSRGYVELLKYYKSIGSHSNFEILEHLIKNKFNENILPTSDEKQLKNARKNS